MIGPHDLLSLARPVLGILLYLRLDPTVGAWWPLGAVALAAATDYLDGPVARASGAESPRGRFLDNICDAVFLAFAFAAFAEASLWSHPIGGSAVSYWEHANWLPLLALLLSFGSYLLRGLVADDTAAPLRRSPRGHAAGVANYLLVLLGAIELTPLPSLGPWVLEPSFVTVALLNFTAFNENALLLASSRLRGRDG